MKLLKSSTDFRSRATAYAISTLLAIWAVGAQSAPADNAADRCQALSSADFSKIEDAPTQIMETHLVPPSSASPGYCEVNGYVAPSFGFLLQLPSNDWNGKIIQHGCAGACGSFSLIGFRCRSALRRGYACILSDGGHKSAPLDMKWAYNRQQAPIDYFVRAPHVTALAGKAVVERYYSKGPQKSYFMGCSSGGIQGAFAAQRFPWDFDGILVASPALNPAGIMINLLWANRALTGEDGQPVLGPADLDLLHRAALAKCDLDDGVKDGVIGDPRHCNFNPAELRCKSGKQSQCLTARQVEAAEKIYRGPVTSRGEQITLPLALKGSEKTWPNWYGVGFRDFAAEWFRYIYFQPNPGPGWKPEDFDFDRDYKRLGMGEAVDPINPDLRRFKASGGKLLMVTGGNDSIEGAQRTMDYYETVERIMGSRAATQDFFRLFVVPGMEHCEGGDGAAAADFVGYLESWVEQGKTPDHLIGSHLRVDQPGEVGFPYEFPLDPAKIEFSRPLYPYPIQTRYLGHGDPKEASSFGPVEPSSEAKIKK